MTPTAEDFISAAAPILRREEFNIDSKRGRRRWMGSFGAMPAVCIILWEKVDPFRTMKEVGTPRLVHLLYGLLFLRGYNTDEQNAKDVGGVDEKTFCKWAHPFVEAISFLEYPIVSQTFITPN